MAAPIVVVQRRDHKLYPPAGVLPEAERRRAVSLTHLLRCGNRLPYRKVVAGLADEGIRVSIGTVYSWTRRYACELCADPARSGVTEISISGAGG